MSLFTAEVKQHVKIIKCPNKIDSVSTVQFVQLTSEWVNTDNVALYIFDFQKVEEVESSAYRFLLSFINSIKQKSKYGFINISKQISLQFSSAGVSSSFKSYINLKDACEKLQVEYPKPQINVKIVNPFLSSLIVKLTELNIKEIKMSKPALKTSETELKFGVIGSISLSCSIFVGEFRIALSTDTIANLNSLFSISSKDDSHSEIQEILGELVLNTALQVSEDLQKELNESIELSSPSVWVVNSIKIESSQGLVELVLPIQSSVGKIQCEIVSSI